MILFVNTLMPPLPTTTLVASGNTCLLSFSHTPWVIDSGASDHMTGNLSLLSNMSPVTSPSFVTIANGAKTPIHGVGTVSTPSLTFSPVLYLSYFPFYLLSVRKLTQYLN